MPRCPIDRGLKPFEILLPDVAVQSHKLMSAEDLGSEIRHGHGLLIGHRTGRLSPLSWPVRATLPPEQPVIRNPVQNATLRRFASRAQPGKGQEQIRIIERPYDVDDLEVVVSVSGVIRVNDPAQNPVVL